MKHLDKRPVPIAASKIVASLPAPRRTVAVHLNSPEGLCAWTAFRRSTSFERESELVPPVKAWLEARSYRVRAEVPIGGRWADLVGAREGDVVAVELKLRDWTAALRQATAYQVGADRAWVAMPLAAASKAYRQRWRFEAECVGLLAVDDAGGVRVPIAARPSPRLLPFVRDGVRASEAARNLRSVEAAFALTIGCLADGAALRGP